MSLKIQKTQWSQKREAKKKVPPQDNQVKLQNPKGKEKTIETSRYERKVTCKWPAVEWRADFFTASVKANLYEQYLSSAERRCFQSVVTCQSFANEHHIKTLLEQQKPSTEPHWGTSTWDTTWEKENDPGDKMWDPEGSCGWININKHWLY